MHERIRHSLHKQYLDNLTVFPDVRVHVIADLFEDAAGCGPRNTELPSGVPPSWR